MADEPRKRSRFDQGPPAEVAQSRAADPRSRSRSPSTRDIQPARTRTPPPSGNDDDATGGDKKREDAMAAAAAAAAKINASIKTNKGPQSVYVPPIRASGTPDEASNSPAPPATPDKDGKSYMQNGDFKRDIEIHDYKTRFLLTNAAAQKKIRDEFGVDVTTKGEYYPDKSLATAARPLLHLHITSTTSEALEKAVTHILSVLDGTMPELIDQRRFRPRGERDEDQQQQQRPQIERDRLGRPKWPEEKIPVDLEPIPDFNLRAQVVGQGGAYVKYIVEQSGARVQVKGHGSHWKERDTGEEIDEPMFLHITDRDAEKVTHAAQLCRELLENVRKNYDEFKEYRSQRPHYGGGGGRGGRGGGYGGHHNNGRQGSYTPGADQYGYGRQQSHDENSMQQGYGGGGGYGGYGGQPQQPQGYEAQYPGQAPGQAGQYPSQSTPTQAATPTQPQAQAGQQQQEGSMQEWIAYYAAHPELDPYAQYGGYAYMMQQYSQQAAQQQQQQPPPPPQQQQQGYQYPGGSAGTPSAAPPGTAGGVPSPPPPPPPPPPPAAAPGT